ncbi:bicaudal D-related protein homolog isoform X2 [Saccostrea echinata]|uniref:bicaudal D-related protein homolog isoform X2 n=1 Tax=Saccostrea echinata TaxID=191078 RepID=UPI002A81AA34|nr:bicaudal D-related protein homolog isoform X2 [Saccostrea echinata]
MCDYSLEANDHSCDYGDPEEYSVSGDNMAEGPGVGEERGFLDEEEEMDVYAQLEQKQKDLTLAAELGKALLEKNEELERRNEQIMEEFAQKIEELEQEKYELYLHLEKKETEYENTIKELQYDISQLREELQSQQHQRSNSVKESSMAIRDLTLQNERLTEDLRTASIKERELESENQNLKEKITARSSSMHVHVGQLEVLQQDINELRSKRQELEKRHSIVLEEKHAVTCSLEESQERILMLEKSKREIEQTVQNQERDIIELQETNVQLQSQLHHMSTNPVTSSHPNKTQSLSLFNEISQLSPDHLSPVTSPESSKTFPVDSDTSGGSFLLDLMEEDEYECDDDLYLTSPVSQLPLHSTLTDSQFLENFQYSSQHYQADKEFHEELVSVYCQLKDMCASLQYGHSDSQECSDYTLCEDIRPGVLSDLLQEFKELMQDVLTFRPTIMEESQVCLDGEDLISVSELGQHITDLKEELRGAQGDLNRLKQELTQRDAQLEQKTQELKNLTGKLSLQHEELSAVQRQRDHLHTALLVKGHMTEHEIIQQARQERDFAIEKKNKMEIELAESRFELLNLKDQLMEAIQQKMVLSQELEQWQSDMEHLFDVHIEKNFQKDTKQQEFCRELKESMQGMRKSKSAINFSTYH